MRKLRQTKVSTVFSAVHCGVTSVSLCITYSEQIKIDHRVLALKDFEDEDIEDVLKRSVFYSRQGHEKKELEFFCEKCEETVRSSCVVTAHDGHVKVLLEQAANEKKLQVMFAIESRKAKVLKMRNEISKIDEHCDNIEANVAKVKGAHNSLLKA